MPHPFMTGWWGSVAVLSWAVPAAVLARYLPAAPASGAGGLRALGDAAGGGPGGSNARRGGMPLTFHADGAPAENPLRLDAPMHPCFLRGDRSSATGAVVSIVARHCTHMRLLGVRWPGVARTSSVSMQFYVRHGQRPGVVCVREVVSSRVVAWAQRKAHNHPSVAAPIECEVKQQTMLIGTEYRVLWPEGGLAPAAHVTRQMPVREHMLRGVGSKPATRPGGAGHAALPTSTPGETGPETVERWLTDRPLVFGADPTGRGLVYEIIHPSWGVHPTVDAEVRMDIAGMFGPDFGFLTGREPQHAMLAVGSEVAVFPRRQSAVVRWGERRER